MKFSNIKLSIGILYIGLIVIISSAALYYDLASYLISSFGDSIVTVYIYICLVLLCTSIFDTLSYLKLNNLKNYNFFRISIANIILLLIFLFFATVTFNVFEQKSLLLCVLSSILVQLSLLPLQKIIVKRVFKGEEKTLNDCSLIIIPKAPKYMTMNILRNFKTSIVVPKHWTNQKIDNYDFHLQRFKLTIKERYDIQSYIFCIILNTILYTIIYFFYLDSNISAATFTIKLSLIFNLISFIYILILPTISQQGIYKIDNIMKEKNLNLFKQNLEIFENNQDKNLSRTKAVESIFYPIPSIKSRLNQKERERFGLPNVSRMIIFYSSFSLSIIFKGVHGNAGKVENWILPPSE